MREVKFRVWDKENNQMITQREVGLSRYQIALTINGDIVMYDKMIKGKASSKENVIVMLSTGLKDKNGKEIYDGDIVKFIFDGEVKISEVEVSLLRGTTVKFGSFNREYEFRLGEIYSPYRKIEVIGSKYEDKDLLK